MTLPFPAGEECIYIPNFGIGNSARCSLFHCRPSYSWKLLTDTLGTSTARSLYPGGRGKSRCSI